MERVEETEPASTATNEAAAAAPIGTKRAARGALRRSSHCTHDPRMRSRLGVRAIEDRMGGLEEYHAVDPQGPHAILLRLTREMQTESRIWKTG